MRLSRRVSHIPSLQAPTPPGPVCSHCHRPLSIQPAYIRCAEPACESLPLCADCFSVGAYDVHPHQPSHPYRVIERVADQIYAKDWAAHEEERLLHALCEHGPYHWKHVSDYVRSKTPAKCERHYHQVYLDSSTAPLPSQITTPSPDVIVEPPSPAAACDGKKVPSDGKKHTTTDAHERTVKPGVKAGVLEGYMPLRGDFDVEWDDEAENLVADLSIGPHDTEEELELKMCLLENYDQRLTRRDAVKKILFDHNLLDFGSHKIGGSRTAKDEKELAARLKVFARLLDKNVYAGVQESITNIYRLSREVHRLAQARDSGVQRLAEVDVYEVERKARAATLSAGNVPDEKLTKKRRRSNGALSSSAKRARKSDQARNQLSNGRSTTPLNPPIVLDENTALMYSPTPDVDALSLGVTTSDVISNPAVKMNVDDADDGGEVPTQSKTALLRKAREQRRLMRSTYPQVEAADMKNMPGAADLAESELVMCCALRIPPAEFITLRDAMLSAFGDAVGPSTSVASESADRRITTMRATRSRTSIQNNELSDTSRIEVAHNNIHLPGRVFDSSTKKGQVCETIKPGRWRSRRVTRVTSANSQPAVEGSPVPCLLDYTTVELDGVPTCSKDEATASKRASDGVSSATCIENDMRCDDESRKYDTHASATNLKACNPHPYRGNMVTSANGGSGGKGDTPDIVVEGAGKRGARLALSLFLPDVPVQSDPVGQRQNVKVAIEVLSDLSRDESAAVSAPIESFERVASNDQGIQTQGSGARDLPEAATESAMETMLPVSSRQASGTRRRRSRKGRGAGRLTIRKRSRTQGRMRGRKPGTRTEGKKAKGVTEGPSPVKMEAKEVENTVPSDDGIQIAQNQHCAKQEPEANMVHGQDVRKEAKCEKGPETVSASEKLIARSDRRNDGGWVGPKSRSGKGYGRFANGAIQEEVLEEGNAAGLDGKTPEVSAKPISGQVLDKAPSNVGSQSEGAQVGIRNSFVYVAPKAALGEPITTAVADRSAQGSESGESDGNVIGKQIQPSTNQCSESGSAPESLSGDDDGDPTVDFTPADEGSDDEDIEEGGRPAPRGRRRSGGRRGASYLPVRVSSRIRKRKREEDKVDVAYGTEMELKPAKEGDVDEEWAGVDGKLGPRVSGKKPPATPVRKSARKKRARGPEETKTGSKTPNVGRYSLRRRG